MSYSDIVFPLKIESVSKIIIFDKIMMVKSGLKNFFEILSARNYFLLLFKRKDFCPITQIQ